LQIRVWVFSKVSGSIKSGIFSGGSFPNLYFPKIGSGFLFRKFLFKFAQVSKISFKVFGLSFGEQAISFGKVVFHGLRFVLQSQVSEIGFKIFSKSFGKFGSGFFTRLIFSGKFHFLAKSVFSKGFGKFSTLRFGKSIVFSKAKVGLVKNCGACKIKSVKGVVLVFRRRVLRSPVLANKACT